ncbi:MAG: LysM peptidoglycan-binding domain-containing protein [Candidatus Binatia bacterium]
MTASRYVVLCTVSACLAGPLLYATPSGGTETAPTVESAESKEQFFHYPIRSGESLSDVSRIFRVPVRDLVELNRITDPNNIALGQSLRIPDSFARDAVALEAERDRLLEEKRRSENESVVRQRALADLDSQFRQLQAEKRVLESEIGNTVQWQRGAKLLSLLLLVVFGWALKSRAERAMIKRRFAALEVENSVLHAAKEKYREAASQFELRYQKLYHGKGEAPKEVIADGVARLSRAFEEGIEEMERLIGNLRLEREKEAEILDAERRMHAWVFHPLRQLLGRRLKYHTP